MSTVTAHTSRGAARRTLAAALAAAICTATAVVTSPASATASSHERAAWSYGWPVKPFDWQHPVRAFFGDPRVGLRPDGTVSHQFHFGIDVSAPDDTPVYATLSGRISIHPDHPDVVLIDGAGGVEFSYWHVTPTVRGGEAVAYKTLIGRIEAPWGHVHFSEMRGGVYVNPLRPGAMGPFADTTRPTVSAVELERTGNSAHVAPSAARGTIDIVAEVADETPVPVAQPWANMPVMPALVRWRIVGRSGAAMQWQTSVDFRETIPAASAYSLVFAKWTRQNHPLHAGRYRVYLAHGWSCAQLPAGRYQVEVAATDSRNNTTISAFPITLEPR